MAGARALGQLPAKGPEGPGASLLVAVALGWILRVRVVRGERRQKGHSPLGRLGVQKGHRLSPSGNRTPVSRVTGGDTHHYTNEDEDDLATQTPARLRPQARPTASVSANAHLSCRTQLTPTPTPQSSRDPRAWGNTVSPDRCPPPSGWPSGLRRCVQVAVSPGGVGSNPTPDNFAT